MNKIFIDSDIILDVVLNREPHVEFSQLILALAENNRVKGYTSSLIIANCFYIIESKFSKSKAKSIIQTLIAFIKVLPVSEKEIVGSLNSKFNDFEDGVQYFVSSNNRIKTIITRNIRDYKFADCVVYSPKEYLSLVDIIT